MKHLSCLSRERAFKVTLLLGVVLSGVVAAPLLAANTVLWTEGFESYNLQEGQTYGLLDKNGTGPNTAPNGSGNPWFGEPSPVNCWVTQAMMNPNPVPELVTPHSGLFMIRGGRSSTNWYSGWDNDIGYVNIAYRFNNGAAFKTGFSVDWWFYDAIGNDGTPPDGGPGNFGDWAAIQYRPTAPTTTDYPGTGSLANSTASLSIGAYEAVAGYDVHVYQVQVQGSPDADFGDGWHNTTLTRSKGWHHASIVVDRCGSATLSLDGTVLLTADPGAPDGFNVFTTYLLQITPDTYNQSVYYDDITLAADLDPPAPADADADGDVDMDDFGAFQACFGTAAAQIPGCRCFDLNQTGASAGKIDIADFIAFRNCASGAGIPAPACP